MILDIKINVTVPFSEERLFITVNSPLDIL